MALYDGTHEIVRLDARRLSDGAIVEVDNLFDRNGRPIYTHASIPDLTAQLDRSYDAAGAAVGVLTLSWVASAGATVRVRRLSDNAAIPNTSNTTAVFAAPAANEVYRITATNQAGKVAQVDIPYWRYTAPAFSNVRVEYLRQPLTGSHTPYIEGTLTMSPWLSPTLTLSPEELGFTSRGFARSVSSGEQDARSFRFAGDPRASTQPHISRDIELRAQLRIGGSDVGAAATATARVAL